MSVEFKNKIFTESLTVKKIVDQIVDYLSDLNENSTIFLPCVEI